jgi:hypothetical protein
MLLAVWLVGAVGPAIPAAARAAPPESVAAGDPWRVAPEVLPSLGCWFWTETEFAPDGFKPFLELVGRHAAFNLLTTSLRVPAREVTDAPVHDQIRRAAVYARQWGMKLVVDLDVRLARVAFQRAYPDELQEMLRFREADLGATGEVTLTVTAEVPSDHYTFAATPYVPVASRLVRVYAARDTGNGLDPASVKEITARCRVVESATNRVRVAIPGDAATPGRRALAAVAFAHLTPDVFAPHVAEYERALWSHALGGGRLNYHPLYPKPTALALDNTAALLRGELMRAEAHLRLLHFIARRPLDCPVAVVFGHACAMNWAGPHYDDVGLGLADALWRRGYPADLIPADEIQGGALRVDRRGRVTYGPQRYVAIVLYHPEYETASTAAFIARAARGPGAVWRLGDWTRDFAARPFDPVLPRSVRVGTNIAACAEQVTAHLRRQGVLPQSPATDSIGWDAQTAAPPRTGTCRLVDGTTVWLAGTEQVAGDPIALAVSAPAPFAAQAVGLLAVRFDKKGRLDALAASRLSRFRGGGVSLELDPPLDVALWHDAAGRIRGVVQDCVGPVPAPLLALCTNWLRLTAKGNDDR